MDTTLAKRGQLVDSLQHRIQSMKLRGKAVPKEWHDKLKQLTESVDEKEIADIEKWTRDLPPEELHTAEINWQSVSHFTGMALTSLAAHHTIATVLKDKVKVDALEKLIKNIAELKHKYDDAAEAYDAFKKLMADFAEKNPKLPIGV
jgi:hypothetical protein